MNYITTLSKNKVKQIELAEHYAKNYQNDFALIPVNDNFIMIRATHYIGMSFINKVKKINN